MHLGYITAFHLNGKVNSFHVFDRYSGRLTFIFRLKPAILALELDDKSVQEVHPIYVGQEDAIRPRFIITARALEEPIDLIEHETESEQDATEQATDRTNETGETEEAVTDERFHSTESGLFTSTSAPSYSTEMASTVPSTEQNLVARIGEAADTSAILIDTSSVRDLKIRLTTIQFLIISRFFFPFKVYSRRSNQGR